MHAIYAKLKKISRNSNALRTDEIEGVFFITPHEHQPSFLFFAHPLCGFLCETNVRIVSTSKVISIEKNLSRIIFTTENSTYELNMTIFNAEKDVKLELIAFVYHLFLSRVYYEQGAFLCRRLSNFGFIAGL